jgi:hypothetical protein
MNTDNLGHLRSSGKFEFKKPDGPIGGPGKDKTAQGARHGTRNHIKRKMDPEIYPGISHDTGNQVKKGPQLTKVEA